MKFRYFSNLDNLTAWLRRLDPTKVWEVSVREWKSKRSLEQNRWIRGFATDLGAFLGYEPDEMYDVLMYKFNPNFVTDKDTGDQIRLAGHFSKLDTAKAAEVQDAVQRWAADMGFYWE